MGWHTNTRNQLHPLMKWSMSCNNENTLSGRSGWVSDLVMWSGSSNRVSRGLKPWAGVGYIDGNYRVITVISSW